jgi:GTP-binding protein
MKTKAHFITSAAKPAQFPPETLPELAVVGRSNVGKSSLINALTGQDGLARTSRTPGRTRLVNWFEVNGKFMLVDLPGYGYAEVSRDMRESWRPLIESYLTDRKTLAGVLLLIDVRRGPQDEELDFVPWLEARKVPIVVALTKSDKLAKNKRMLEVTKAKKQLGLKREPFAVSAQTGEGLEALWRAVTSVLPSRAPRGPASPDLAIASVADKKTQ